MICFACRQALPRAKLLTKLPPSSSRALSVIAGSQQHREPRRQIGSTQCTPRSSLATILSAYNPNKTISRPSSSSAASQPGPTQASATAIPKPEGLDAAESEIWDRLSAALSPTELLVRDVSGGCGSMYSIDISSPNFRGLSMLKQQRMVNSLLADLMTQWHGVQLRTKAP